MCVPDLSLQRILRAREAAGVERGASASRRIPLAVEHNGYVVACDAEARERGVRRGEALAQARAACAELELVPADEAEDRAALEGLAEALLALAPVVEIAWPDTLLLDASGAHLLPYERGTGAEWEALLAERAVALAAGLGLRCRAAVASGRAPARALARHGRAPTPSDAGSAALAGLPISALELSAPLEGRLTALGLREVGDLARLPAEALAHRFGAAGLAAWRLAHGDDPSPLVPYVPERLPEERLELEAPVESSEPLLFGLKRLCDRLAARLAGRSLGATRLALVLLLDPRSRKSEVRLEIRLASPSSAASRWLLVLRERLAALRLPGAVTAAVLGVAEAAPAPIEQLAIGDRPEQLAALEGVLVRLAARLGDGALFAAEPVNRHRPESAYQAGAFAVKKDRRKETGKGTGKGRRNRANGAEGPSNGVEAGSERLSSPAASPPISALVRPTRLLPHPQPLVALGEGGRLTALRVDQPGQRVGAGGQTLRVLALSPAERLAGEWWGDPFDRDYHRASIEGMGDCWIFRDAGDGRLWLHGFFD
ncbi:MAG: hypothetical protein A2V77_07120 [Anaeromyxobacter sp. RBG_16_69_14]|nr:MAG: hypothetical protein A2V77_07120 [Anaeromyxobacter sp. RBG_16_69_14]